MNLFRLLQERATAGKPVRVGLIGAGKFGSMFLAQARRTPGLHILGIADLSPQRARDNLALVGWPAEAASTRSPDEAVDRGTTWIGDDALALIAHPAAEVVIDATGNPPAGIVHAEAAIAHGKHIVMVNVEADALAGPMLARGPGERRGLQPRLWRPAGAHRGTGRLGARRRLRRGRRRQGH